MNPHGDGKPEPADPEQLLRTLDLELMQQRALRQQIAARRNNLRALSFLFLFLVILGVAVATYFAFTSGRIEDLRVRHPSPPTATPATAHHP